MNGLAGPEPRFDLDPLTHTFLGGTLARAGLDRRTPLALPTLLIGANLPDVDVLTYVVSPDFALLHRRGWTHGPIAMVVLPVVLTLAMLAWDRLRRSWNREATPARPAQLLLLATLGVWSHPLLDWLNTYGVRFLMPFDGTWFYGDAVFIIDPWVWLAFGGVLFLHHSQGRRRLALWGSLAVLATLVVMAGAGPHHWARVVWLLGIATLVFLRWRLGADEPHLGRRRTRIVLAAVLGYAFFMVATSFYAERAAAAAARQSARWPPIERLMVGPSPVDPLARVVVAESAEQIHFGSFHWLSRPRVRLDGGSVEKEPSELEPEVLDAALASPCVSGMVHWMRFPFFAVDELEGGHRVHLLDGRYVRERTRAFGADSVRVREDLSTECTSDSTAE